jgi:hypothetical protein
VLCFVMQQFHRQTAGSWSSSTLYDTATMLQQPLQALISSIAPSVKCTAHSILGIGEVAVSCHASSPVGTPLLLLPPAFAVQCLHDWPCARPVCLP